MTQVDLTKAKAGDVVTIVLDETDARRLRSQATSLMLYPNQITSLTSAPTPAKEYRLEDNGEQYFLVARDNLTQEQYERLKTQIDEAWPENQKRPILLEGLQVIKL